MANVTYLRWRAQIALLKFQPMSFTRFPSRDASTVSTANDENEKETDIDNELLWAQEEEKAHLEKLQNVSGLPPTFYQHLHGKVVEPPFKDLERRRKLYMTYGSNSGEDPRLLWPSRQQIAEMQAEEKEDEVPLMEKIQFMTQEKDDSLKDRVERHKMIEKNMAQMSKWISEYNKKVEDAELEIQKKREKKDALLDEARDYFGYRIKANDPKFEQMVEEKQEKERKEAKEKKKKEKARKLAERLKQDMLAMKLSSETESESKLEE